MANRFAHLSALVYWQRLPGEMAEKDGKATAELSGKVTCLCLSPDQGVQSSCMTLCRAPCALRVSSTMSGIHRIPGPP